MRQLKERFRSHSPVPPAAAEGSNAPTHSTKSDTLASIIKVLDVAEKAVDGLHIYGPKAVISSIRTVLQSVKVRFSFFIHPLDRGYLCDHVFTAIQR